MVARYRLQISVDIEFFISLIKKVFLDYDKTMHSKYNYDDKTRTIQKQTNLLVTIYIEIFLIPQIKL